MTGSIGSPVGSIATSAVPAAAAPAPQGLMLAAERLSDRLAEALHLQIDAGHWAPGARLPTELALATQYGVSRTVVREAVSRLRSMGLLVARQGSGVFVAQHDAARPLPFDAAVLANQGAVLEVVEVRRALESEVAALAAARATPAQRRAIAKALQQVDASVASGSAGIEEDLDFHRAVAEASGNPQFARLLRHLVQYLRGAMTVTRANEARKPEFIAQVRQEHDAIARAIASGDAEAARAAATAHMLQAARRLQQADAPVHRALAVPVPVAKPLGAPGTPQTTPTAQAQRRRGPSGASS